VKLFKATALSGYAIVDVQLNSYYYFKTFL